MTPIELYPYAPTAPDTIAILRRFENELVRIIDDLAARKWSITFGDHGAVYATRPDDSRTFMLRYPHPNRAKLLA